RRHAFHDLHFADRLDADDVDLADAVVLRDLARAGVGAGVGAVRGDRHRRAAEAVEAQTNAAGAAAAGAAALDRAFLARQPGADVQQVGEIAIGRRQRLDLDRIEVDALLGRRGVDERRLAAHRHTLFDRADFEIELASHALRRAERYAL